MLSCHLFCYCRESWRQCELGIALLGGKKTVKWSQQIIAVILWQKNPTSHSMVKFDLPYSQHVAL